MNPGSPDRPDNTLIPIASKKSETASILNALKKMKRFNFNKQYGPIADRNGTWIHQDQIQTIIDMIEG